MNGYTIKLHRRVLELHRFTLLFNIYFIVILVGLHFRHLNRIETEKQQHVLQASYCLIWQTQVALSVTWYLNHLEQQNNCLHEIESEKKYTAE